MSEPVRLAKLAREHLASALNTLQSEDNIPDELMDTADPIAEAMSVLHRIERSGGAVLDGRTEALKKVRSSLNLLLGLTDSHPAIEKVMESVALALTKVATLVRYTPESVAAAPAPIFIAPAPVAPAPAPVVSAPAPVISAPEPIFIAPEPVAPAPAPVVSAPEPIFIAPEPVAPAPAPIFIEPAPLAPAPAPIFIEPAPAVSAPAPVVSAPAPVVSAPAPVVSAPAPVAPAPIAPAAPLAAVKREPTLRPLPGAPHIDVELGTSSASNFYRGLGGDDVVDHGGIFIATYKIPSLGAQVNLRVLLPGNFQFIAHAEVRWMRGSGVSVDSAEPGFGARFTQISHEGRQLIRRYTRNREPIFYDDL